MTRQQDDPARATFTAIYEERAGEFDAEDIDAAALHPALDRAVRAECAARGFDPRNGSEYKKGRDLFFARNPDLHRAWLDHEPPQRARR
jgi:hypothetical protein